MLAEARVGTSGFAYREWVGPVYPEGLSAEGQLAWYARQLSTVEISSSFSRAPTPEQIDSWARSVQPGFQLALKLPGRICQDLRVAKSAARPLAAFLDAVSELGEHLGPLLVQLPETFAADRRALTEFLRTVPRSLRFAFEFRHPSWRSEATLRVLSAHNAALVLTDDGDGAPPLELTADFTYVRIRREDDQAEAWAEWAERLAALTRRGVDVYAYVKQDRKGLAVERARRLSSLLRQEYDQGAAPLLT